jgi:hypothetical protein
MRSASGPTDVPGPEMPRPPVVRRAGELLLVLPLLVLFLDAIRPMPVVESSDGLGITIPRLMFAVGELRQGRIPLWNEYSFCGTPLLADSNTLVLHPGTLLYFALPPIWAYTATLIILYAVLIVGCWLYFRELGLGIAGSLVATVAYALSGQVVFWLLYHGMNLAICLLPMTLFALRRYEATERWLWAVLGWALLATTAFGGFIQFVLYSGAAVVLEGVRALDGDDPWRHAARRLVLVALSVATSAVILVPSAEAVLASHRGLVPYESGILPARWSVLLANMALGAADRFRSTYPHYFYAVGAAILAFAAYAIRGDPGRALRSPFVWYASIFPGIALATYAGWLPLWTDPFRGMYVFSLMLSSLGGIGADRMLATLAGGATVALPAEHALVAACLPAMALLDHAGSRRAAWSGLFLAVAILGGFHVAGWIARRRSEPVRRAIFAVWAVSVVFANGIHARDHWRTSVARPGAIEPLLEFPPAIRGAAGRTSRVAVPGTLHWGNWAIVCRVRSLGGRGSIFPRRIFERIRDDGLIDPGYSALTDFRNSSRSGSRLLARYGVQYLLIEHPRAASVAPGPGWELHGEPAPGDRRRVFTNTAYVGRAYVAGGDGEIVRPARIIENTATRVKIAVTGVAGELLILSDSWFPGWVCYDGGARAAGIESGGFRGYRLPSTGEHVIEWKYEPVSYRYGAALSVAGFLASVAYLARLRRQTRIGAPVAAARSPRPL